MQVWKSHTTHAQGADSKLRGSDKTYAAKGNSSGNSRKHIALAANVVQASWISASRSQRTRVRAVLTNNVRASRIVRRVGVTVGGEVGPIPRDWRLYREGDKVPERAGVLGWKL